MVYRMAIEAAVMLSIEASSEEEAKEKTQKIVDQYFDGTDLPSLSEDAEGFRLYFQEKPMIEVENIEEP